MNKICQKEIPSKKNPLISTYCTRKEGHDGECSSTRRD
jgi:hypothetical protein